MVVTHLTRIAIHDHSTHRRTLLFQAFNSTTKQSMLTFPVLSSYVLTALLLNWPDVTWITDFIIPYMDIPELAYLFIVLNSLQGPVIREYFHFGMSDLHEMKFFRKLRYWYIQIIMKYVQYVFIY